MNQIGFTASALGNHEFDKGVAGLQNLQKVAQFPYLADNNAAIKAKTGARVTGPGRSGAHRRFARSRRR